MDALTEVEQLELIADLLTRPVEREITDAVQAALEELCTPAEIARSARAEVDEEAAAYAGATVLSSGRDAGRRLDEAVTAAGERWLRWLCKQQDHPIVAEARRFARVFYPEIYGTAMGELAFQQEWAS